MKSPEGLVGGRGRRRVRSALRTFGCMNSYKEVRRR